MTVKKMFQKYKQISKPAKASIWFVICSVIQKGIAFLVSPIFTRMLTAEQYGIYNVYTTWLSIFSIFITFNMSFGVFNNAMVKYEHDRDRYISSMQGLTLLTSCIGLVIYGLFYSIINNITELTTFMTMAMFIQIMFTPAHNYWNAYQRYQYNYCSLIILTICIAIFTPLTSVLLIKYGGMEAEGRVLSALVIQVIVGSFLWIRQYKRGKVLYVKDYWRFSLRLAIPLIPHYLSQIMLNSADKIMISKLCDDNAVGFYSLAYSVALIIQLFTTSINNTLIPWTYQQLKKEAYANIQRIANLILVALALGIIAFIAVGPEVIRIMGPIEYYEARWVIPPVACSVFFMFLYNIFGNVEFYFEKTKQIAFVSIICAVVNILLNWIFIPIYGYVAAGYTTLVCYILFSICHYILMKRICRTKIPNVNVYDGKFIILLSFIFLILVVGLTLLYDMPLVRFSCIIIVLVILLLKKHLVIESVNVLLDSKKGRK